MRLYELLILLEYNRDITKQKLGDKLVLAAKQDRNQDIDTILTAFEEIDPTTNKGYIKWIANQYIALQFKLEDKTRVHTALDNFNQLKPQLAQKDINRYTLSTLDNLLRTMSNSDTQPASISDKAIYPIVPDTKIIYNGHLGQLALPETEEAGCILGKGANWDISRRNSRNFNYYLKTGLPYIWIDSDKNKYMFSFGTYDSIVSGNRPTFVDSNNNLLDTAVLNQFRAHPILSKMFKRQERKFLDDPEIAYLYATKRIPGQIWPEGEEVIASDPEYAFLYASIVLKRRWPEGEKAIASHPYYITKYTKDFLNGKRWPEAEETILRNPTYATAYVSQIMGGKRWIEAEEIIAADPKAACSYALNIIEGPWPEAEETIATDPRSALTYIKHVGGGMRWLPEAEESIASNPETAFHYALDVLHGKRWPKGEKIIASSPEYACRYARYIIEDPWPEAEPIIASNPVTAYEYAKTVLKKRWPEAEPMILSNAKIARWYATGVIKGSWSSILDGK